VKKVLKLALMFSLPLVLCAQAPQIPVTGTLGAGGVFPLINSPGVVFATDANHTMSYPEMSGSSGFILVTSNVSLTATRNLIAPLVAGFMWAIENATTGGHSIQVIGSTGTGVTIPSGYTMPVYCDGTNYVTNPAASGGTVLGVTGTAPVASSGGTNPVISMAQANATTNGWLLSTDWAAFNAKQAPLGYTPAHAGANSDITSLSGLTTPLSTSQGGSGSGGGTGYRFGNGVSPDSYSSTIPCASVTGANCSGTGTLNSYPVSFSLSSSYGGTATVTCQSNACTSIAGLVKYVSSVPCVGCQLEMTSSNAYPSNTYCSSNLVPQVSATPSGTTWSFSAIGGGVNFSTYVLSSLSTFYISYSCILQ
jgi:trimeric autotransporter adhesin